MPHGVPYFGRRQQRERGSRIPVVVVTGFLGAGKTTLLMHLLASEAGARSAVIVNEFGEIGIDGSLLRASSDNVVQLDNGCLCCAVRSDLEETLLDLLAQRLAGTVPDFERVIIETSGLADPGPIVQTFMSNRMLGRDYHMSGVVTVADAAAFDPGRDLAPEYLRQVALADRLVVSKVDLVTPEALAAATAALSAINPAAAMAHADRGAVEPAFVLEHSALSPKRTLPGEHTHTSGVTTFSIVEDEPLDWGSFTRAMEALGTLRGPDLLRVKGFVAVRGRSGPVVVHFVQHQAHPPIELERWPDEDRRTRLVFVTRAISRQTVVDLIRALQRLAVA